VTPDQYRRVALQGADEIAPAVRAGLNAWLATAGFVKRTMLLPVWSIVLGVAPLVARFVLWAALRWLSRMTLGELAGLMERAREGPPAAYLPRAEDEGDSDA